MPEALLAALLRHHQPVPRQAELLAGWRLRDLRHEERADLLLLPAVMFRFDNWA